VGDHAITQGTLALSANYDLTFVPGKLTIDKRIISVSADTDTKTYDGTTDSSAIPAVTFGSLATGDVGTWSESFDTPGAGTDKALTPTGTVENAEAVDVTANYDITFEVDHTGVIERRAITATADDKNKTYGDADPALTYGLTSGTLVPGDDFSGEITRTAGEGVGDHAITQGTLALSADYDLTFVPGKLTIDKRVITVSGTSDTKTYDGDRSSSAVPTVTFGSLAAGDTGLWTQTFDTKHAGTDKALTPTGTVENAGHDDMTANYDITFTADNAGVIEKRIISVSADTDTKTYDGTTDSSAIPAVTFGSLATGDVGTRGRSRSTHQARVRTRR